MIECLECSEIHKVTGAASVPACSIIFPVCAYSWPKRHFYANFKRSGLILGVCLLFFYVFCANFSDTKSMLVLIFTDLRLLCVFLGWFRLARAFLIPKDFNVLD